ncbi:nucleotide-binding domain-containing protein [Enterobacter cloacae]
MRGQILDDNGTLSCRETTSFLGNHIVECYLVKNEVVIARQSLLVPIE